MGEVEAQSNQAGSTSAGPNAGGEVPKPAVETAQTQEEENSPESPTSKERAPNDETGSEGEEVEAAQSAKKVDVQLAQQAQKPTQETAQKESRRESRSWRENRTPTQQEIDEYVNNLIEIVRGNLDALADKDEAIKKILTKTLSVCEWIDNNPLEKTRYVPETGEFVNSEGNPDNFQRHLKTIVYAVRRGIQEQKLPESDLEKARKVMQKLEPRLIETEVMLGEEKHDGYIILEVRETEKILKQSAGLIPNELIEKIEAKGEGITPYERLLLGRALFCLLILENPRCPLSSEAKLQLVAELVEGISGEIQFPSINFERLKREIAIRNNENTDDGAQKPFNKWLIDKMKQFEIGLTDEQIKNIQAMSSLNAVSSLEAAFYQIKKIKGIPLIGNLLKNFARPDISAFGELARKEEAIRVITQNLVGGEGILDESKLSPQLLKLLGRQKEGFPTMWVGTGLMLLYSQLLGMITEEGRDDELFAQAA